MTFASVKVLPVPVTPSRTVWGRPSPRQRDRGARWPRGWSPPNGGRTPRTAGTTELRRVRTRDRDQVLPPRVEEGRGVRVAQQVHREEELRVHGLADQPQPRLLERAVALVEVAAQAGRHHVGPGRLPAARPRDDVVHGQPLPAAAAVLAGVAVAAEDVLLVEGDPLEEGLADVHGEPDHRRQGKAAGRRPDDPRRGLDALGFPRQQERDGAPGVGEMQRLVGIVEHEYRYFIHIPRLA